MLRERKATVLGRKPLAKEDVDFTSHLRQSRCKIDQTEVNLLKDILTLVGAACIGWAIPNLIASVLPFYGMGNFRTIALNSLILSVGVIFVVTGYGIHRRAIFAWLLGCLLYTVLVAYLFWRSVVKLELNSYFLLLALIAAWPFAALWWRYTKLYFGDKADD